jgi:hypothetical protein
LIPSDGRIDVPVVDHSIVAVVACTAVVGSSPVAGTVAGIAAGIVPAVVGIVAAVGVVGIVLRRG